MRKKLLSVVLALAVCLTLAVPAAAVTPVTSINSFTDVSSDSYYWKGVNWAVNQGITNGTSPTTFSPSDLCTMPQILAFLWRSAGRPGAAGANLSWDDELPLILNWAKSKGITKIYLNGWCSRETAVDYMWKAAGSPEPTVTAKFEDVPPYADYAKAVSWAVEKGITNGTSNVVFSPSQICTRGEIVTFLYRQAVEPLEVTLPSHDVLIGQVISTINAKRAEAGVAPLETYSALTAAAQLRSAEVRQSVSNTRPDGTSYVTALAETGADQNVVASAEAVNGQQPVPTGLVSALMTSSTANYKSTILDPKFTHIGVGYTYNSRSSHCWSLIFVRVDGAPNNTEVTLPDQPDTNPQYDENGVLISTDPYIKLSYLICDRMKENTATERSKSFTGLLMNKDDWRDYHGQNYTTSWKTDNPGIVSLEERMSDGIVTGVYINPLKAGKTTITCTVTGQDGYSAEAYCYVTVQPRTTSTTTPAAPGTSSSNMTAEQMCARVVELVNQERSRQGLSPLSTLPSLTAAANIRAPELSTLFSHNRPDGTQCYTALREAGITSYRAAGENIAAGQSSPEQVMNSWMNSPGHKANILNSNFTHIGVGYYNGGWVQMFIGTR